MFAKIFAHIKRWSILFINAIRDFGVIVTIVNLIVLTIIVPYQAQITRKHQLTVLDYRSIRDSLTALRLNDKYTYDLCNKRDHHLKTNDGRGYFEKSLKELLENRARKLSNLIVAGMDMDKSFNKTSFEEVKWFIGWNNKLNLSGTDVCDLKLMSGEDLISWELMVLREMRKSL